MQKYVKIALIVISLISAILWFQLPGSDVPASEAVNSSALNGMFIITNLLLGIAVFVSLFYALKNLFSNPQSLKKTLFVLGGLAIIVGISYVMSSGTDVAPEYQAMASEATIKNIGMGLNVFFFLTVVAVILMIVPSVKKLFAK